jgi:alpha-tubulin suppressor-like RCC1 family protein
VPELTDALEISAGAGHSCALRAGGRAVCWGRNDSGQLGDGTRRASARPVSVRDLEQSLHVAAGGLDDGGELIAHSCAQTKGFNVRCWGRNREGQLGNGTVTDSPVAVLVLDRPDLDNDTTYLDDVANVAAGGAFSCNLDDGGPVYCWGDNRKGELGLHRDTQPVVGRAMPVRRFSFPE